MQVNSDSYSYMNAYAASATYKTSNMSISGSYFEITGGTSKVSSDGVDVSETAKELANRIKELDIFKVIFPNNDARQDAKSLDEVGNDFMSDFNDFSSMFGKMASMMGLDSSSTFSMGLNGAGGMTVNGSDETMTSKLSDFFNSPQNSTTVSRFAVMAARAALVDAGNTVDGFKDSYANDPFSAITDNIDALKERLLGFRTEASGGTMNYGFIRSFSMQLEYSSTSATYGSTGTDDTADTATETETSETTETPAPTAVA